jgi:cytochrome P450
VAQTLEWMLRPIPFMRRCRERYGPIFSVRLGPGRNVFMVADAHAAKEVLVGDPRILRAGDTNGVFRPVVGSSSLLLLDGDDHMRHRRIMLPAFAGGHIHKFAHQVEEITRRRIESWSVGERLSLRSEMEAISFESIMRVAFGDQKDGRQERLRELIPEMMDRCDSSFILLPWFRRELGGAAPYARLMRVVGEIDELLLEAINERRADPLAQLRDDALSLLVMAGYEDGSPLTDREIRDELLTLLMAGYETTTSALAWAFERLLHSPESLARLVGELAASEERYLDAVVKETLRIRPVVPVVARKLGAPTELLGYSIPAGSVLMVSIYLLHHDPEAYERPDEFSPERFLGGIPEGAAWIPFGGGVRRCIGAGFAQLEMKVVLRTILAAVSLRAAGGPEKPARRRFTFAPERGAGAYVEDLAPQRPRPEPARRRFRRRRPVRGLVRR